MELKRVSIMDENLLKVLSRIKSTQDGIDFIEFLVKLSKNNYEAFKQSPREFNDIHKGQAVAIDGLLDEFEHCEEKLKLIEQNKNNTIEYNPDHNPNF